MVARLKALHDPTRQQTAALWSPQTLGKRLLHHASRKPLDAVESHWTCVEHVRTTIDHSLPI
jgi:hypothetical protein